MSEIKIRRTHSLALEDAREVADGVAARLKKDYGLDCTWKRNCLHFQRPGVAGELHVSDHDVRLEAKLGLLVSFLKPRIEQEIEAQFDKHFNPPPARKPAAKKATPGSGGAGRPHKAARRPRNGAGR
jgi:putative polyhydroxyalkanoate system protein